MKYLKYVLCILIIMWCSNSIAGTAIGRVTTNQQQLYKYQLGKAWGWCNDEYKPEMNWAHRNLFNPTDDCVKKPDTKIILLVIPDEEDNKYN